MYRYSYRNSIWISSQCLLRCCNKKIFKIGTLEKIIREVDENLIQNVSTFDVYEGENIPKDKKSIAINVTLQAIDKTLSENDLDEISKKIIDIVSKKTGAKIRS